MEPQDERYLTPKDLVARYGADAKGEPLVSERLLERWRQDGRLGPPYMKLGGKVVYKLSDLMEWERKQTIKPKR